MLSVVFYGRENKILQRMRQINVDEKQNEFNDYDDYLDFRRSGVAKVSSHYVS
jgi:hypothetical protein